MTWDGLEWINVGQPDTEALAQIRTVAGRHEPLIERSEYDSTLNPTELRLFVSQGFEAESGRFDISWTIENYYRFHYTEASGINFRYDRHPHPDAPEKHFHPPPDCPDHEADPSCIKVETVPLVTMAVMQLWGEAVRAGDTTLLVQDHPP